MSCLVLKQIPVEQTLALTTFIEAGYQEISFQTSAVFVNLFAAYDTVWGEKMIYKLLKRIRCLKTIALLNNMIRAAKYKQGEKNYYSTCTSPTSPKPDRKNCCYADDIALAYRAKKP